MRKLFVLLMAGLVISTTACGGGGPDPQDDPKGALIDALKELAKYDAVTITFSLQSTTESLVAASEGSFDEGFAETILGSSFTISGTNVDDPEDQNARIAFNVEGTEGAEFLIIGTDVYLRGDVRGLAEAFGADTASIDQIAADAEAQGLDFVGPAIDGEFLRIEGADQLAGQVGADPQELTAQQEEAFTKLSEALEESSTVESVGQDDVGDHVVARASLRELYEKGLEIAQDFAPIPPEGVTPASEVPDVDLEIDFWIADGKIVQIEFDIVKLAESLEEELPTGVEELAARVTISDEAEEVDAPDDAVTITQEDIGALLFSGIGSGEESVEAPVEQPSPGGGDDVCALYKDLPPETFEGLPEDAKAQIQALCPEVIPD